MSSVLYQNAMLMRRSSCVKPAEQDARHPASAAWYHRVDRSCACSTRTKQQKRHAACSMRCVFLARNVGKGIEPATTDTAPKLHGHEDHSHSFIHEGSNANLPRVQSRAHMHS
jgi:hypothetical protein